MLDTDSKHRIDTARDILVGKITLIGFKTGRVGRLADKYRPQIVRYRGILQELFPGRSVEGYLFFVEEPHRIVLV